MKITKKENKKPETVKVDGNGDRIRFWILLAILLLSLALAWFINSSLSQTLSTQFN